MRNITCARAPVLLYGTLKSLAFKLIISREGAVYHICGVSFFIYWLLCVWHGMVLLYPRRSRCEGGKLCLHVRGVGHVLIAQLAESRKAILERCSQRDNMHCIATNIRYSIGYDISAALARNWRKTMHIKFASITHCAALRMLRHYSMVH